jgi:glutathione S-transferase
MKLYELCGADKQRFSPYCWRTRMALALKGLEAEAVPVGFTEIPAICGGTGKTVPVLETAEGVVVDSFDIALHLDKAHPDKPLFRGAAAQAHCRMIEAWTNTAVMGGLAQMIMADIWLVLSDADKAYFRESREKRFGKTLEEFQAGREETVKVFNAVTMATPRRALSNAEWLGGDQPDYADCILFGTLMWAAVVSDFAVLEGGPVKDWFRRCLALMPNEPEVKAVLAA